MIDQKWDVIIIGGGHAGTEAAWAAANALNGGKVALITMDPSRIAAMSCNPAIGGLAKGQIAREIDALGGLMGQAIDRSGIMFKVLNQSRGPAVRGPRAQADKYKYPRAVQDLIASHKNITVISSTVEELLVKDKKCIGVRLPKGAGISVPKDQSEIDQINTFSMPRYGMDGIKRSSTPIELYSHAVVLTTGTFLKGLMHEGENKTEGGRIGEGSSVGMSGELSRLGFELGRLKTGTPPRLDRRSIDWESLPIQRGDDDPVPFSDLTDRGKFPLIKQVECRVTHTTEQAHELIKNNLHRAPMFSGAIDAEAGPRYCPSIEDKVVRFVDRLTHHVFLEPESLDTDEIYANGISTSLPLEIQKSIVSMMPGCQNARIIKPGYAVEYDVVWPHQIDATTMTKLVDGLFFAGQLNGTSGYEEAGGQGLLAGLNAARYINNEVLIRLSRDQAYIGVMMDDLVTKKPREPYRMFTSRAEHRLRLRADTTDARLTPLGKQWGLIDDMRWSKWEKRKNDLENILDEIKKININGKALAQVIRQPEITVKEIELKLDSKWPSYLVERVIHDLRYESYVKRGEIEIQRQKELDSYSIPKGLDFLKIEGLRNEAKESLQKYNPLTIGQAGRLAGVSPADIQILRIALLRKAKK